MSALSRGSLWSPAPSTRRYSHSASLIRSCLLKILQVSFQYRDIANDLEDGSYDKIINFRKILVEESANDQGVSK